MTLIISNLSEPPFASQFTRYFHAQASGQAFAVFTRKTWCTDRALFYHSAAFSIVTTVPIFVTAR